MSDSAATNVPHWLEGTGVEKKISNDRLTELMQRVTPLIMKDDKLRKFKPVNPRTQSMIWSPEFYGAPVTSFRLLKEVAVDFPCGYYGLFKPSIAEVLAWFPEAVATMESPDGVNAFYLDSHADVYGSGEFQRCTVYFGMIDAKDRRGPSPFKKLPKAPPSLKRTDEQMVRFLDGVQGIVEANSNERHMLWERWHYKPVERRKLDWESNNSGMMETVGFINKRPICVTLWTAAIDGKKILFVDATSQLVDWAMIDKWIADNLPGVDKVDAQNFYNIIR